MFALRFSANRVGLRRLNTSSIRMNSLFGELTKSNAPTESLIQKNESEEVEDSEETSKRLISPKDDVELQNFYTEQVKSQQIEESKFITPLKRELFKLNVAKNGFFKNHDIVSKDSTKYKLSLTEKEIDILEPTVYLKSLRIKSSMKKATVVNRFVRGMNVKAAINQLHFNPKKMSTELEILLKQALKQAKDVGIDEDSAYIQSLWVGSDGNWQKRPDIKGRGRMGVIQHKYVHLKVIIKGETTKKRLDYEKNLKDSFKKPRVGLNTEPLNTKTVPFYKW